MRDRVITPAEAALQEMKEDWRRTHAAWLGGFFDVTGTLSMTISQRGTPYARALPQMALKDSNPHKIYTLHTLLDGRTYPKKADCPRIWSVRDQEAVQLARTFDGFAPSRQDRIDAFKEYEFATTEQRVEIAEALQAREPEPLDPTLYASLVRNPQFLAGIIDGKALIGSRQHVGKSELQLALQSQNRVLLETLQAEFGGSFYPKYEEGETRLIINQEYVLDTDCFVWSLGDRRTRSFLGDIQNDLVVQKQRVRELLKAA